MFCKDENDIDGGAVVGNHVQEPRKVTTFYFGRLSLQFVMTGLNLFDETLQQIFCLEMSEGP